MSADTRLGWVAAKNSARSPLVPLARIAVRVEPTASSTSSISCALDSIEGSSPRAGGSEEPDPRGSKRISRQNAARDCTSRAYGSTSRAASIEHGFATVSRFFPGGREALAAIDDEVVFGALGQPLDGKARCFEDQYISSGGQLYELFSGHDRFIADLRPLVLTGGDARGICAHPYDLSTELIARELGVIVTDAKGGRLSYPLDLDSNVAWIGYANEALRAQIEPLLKQALSRRGLRP